MTGVDMIGNLNVNYDINNVFDKHTYLLPVSYNRAFMRVILRHAI